MSHPASYAQRAARADRLSLSSSTQYTSIFFDTALASPDCLVMPSIHSASGRESSADAKTPICKGLFVIGSIIILNNKKLPISRQFVKISFLKQPLSMSDVVYISYSSDHVDGCFHTISIR